MRRTVCLLSLWRQPLGSSALRWAMVAISVDVQYTVLVWDGCPVAFVDGLSAVRFDRWAVHSRFLCPVDTLRRYFLYLSCLVSLSVFMLSHCYVYIPNARSFSPFMSTISAITLL